jgi:hypothetical protein
MRVKSTAPFPITAKSPAEELAQEKGADQDRQRGELPTKSRQNAQADRKRNRGMNRDKPWQSESPHSGAPEPEGKVYEEHRDGHRPQGKHSVPIEPFPSASILLRGLRKENIRG